MAGDYGKISSHNAVPRWPLSFRFKAVSGLITFLCPASVGGRRGLAEPVSADESKQRSLGRAIAFVTVDSLFPSIDARSVVATTGRWIEGEREYKEREEDGEKRTAWNEKDERKRRQRRGRRKDRSGEVERGETREFALPPSTVPAVSAVACMRAHGCTGRPACMSVCVQRAVRRVYTRVERRLEPQIPFVRRARAQTL